MRSAAFVALWALSTLSHASDLPLDEAVGLAKRIPIVAAPAPTVVIRARHMSERRRHHARRARQQNGASAADAGVQKQASAAQQQGQANSSQAKSGEAQAKDAQGSTDATKSDSFKPDSAAAQQKDSGGQSQDNGAQQTGSSDNGSQDGKGAQSFGGNTDAQSATENSAATQTRQDQPASTPFATEAKNQQSTAEPTRTDNTATAEQATESRSTETSERNGRNGNDRTTSTEQATTSRTEGQREQGAKQGQATATQVKFGQNKQQAAPAATPAAKAAAAAAAGDASPGFASLSAALAKQKAGQDAGFSASSSALAAKFTAASDNNFGGKGSKSVSQSSLQLDKSQVNIGSFSPGNPAVGQANSLTSKNNFINFCAEQAVPLMNGLQQRARSCNPIPMGIIVPVEQAPTVKWAIPVQGQTLPANKNITLTLNVKNIQTGVFTDAQGTYFSAPQTVNDEGLIIGHGHLVVNQVSSCTDTTPADPRGFVFFKGIDGAAVNGALTTVVSNGFPPGAYRACSMMSSANHQPVLVSLAQRTNQDDCVCFFTK